MIKVKVSDIFKQMAGLSTLFDGHKMDTLAYRSLLKEWRAKVDKGCIRDKENFEKDLSRAMVHYEKQPRFRHSSEII
jgi:hypothetical protein